MSEENAQGVGKGALRVVSYIPKENQNYGGCEGTAELQTFLSTPSIEFVLACISEYAFYVASSVSL